MHEITWINTKNQYCHEARRDIVTARRRLRYIKNTLHGTIVIRNFSSKDSEEFDNYKIGE